MSPLDLFPSDISAESGEDDSNEDAISTVKRDVVQHAGAS